MLAVIFCPSAQCGTLDVAAGADLSTVVYPRGASSADGARSQTLVTVEGASTPEGAPEIRIGSLNGRSFLAVSLQDNEPPDNPRYTTEKSGQGYVRIGGTGNQQFQEIFLREDGCLEWLLCLESRPVANQFIFPLIIRGLTFYYQDGLSDFEKSLGSERPDSVVNSWAAYYSSPMADRRGTSTGKAFHIYRPRIWDSSGDSVWADLWIDAEASQLTIKIDPIFLDRAVYPVTIAPTFGFSTAGASSTALSTVEAWGNKNSAYFFTADGTETVDSLYACLKSYSAGTYYADIAMYTVESGNPSQRAGNAATVSGAGSSVTWRGVDIGESLTNGTTYSLCVGNPINGTRIQYDTGISGQNSRQTTSTQLGATWDHVVNGTMLLSIYAVYSTGTSSPGVSSLRRQKEQQSWIHTGGR